MYVILDGICYLLSVGALIGLFLCCLPLQERRFGVAAVVSLWSWQEGGSVVVGGGATRIRGKRFYRSYWVISKHFRVVDGRWEDRRGCYGHSLV